MQGACPGTVELLHIVLPLWVPPKEENALKVSPGGFHWVRYRYVSHGGEGFSAFILAQPPLNSFCSERGGTCWPLMTSASLRRHLVS